MGESRTGAARPAATLGGVRVPDIFASLQADLVDRYRFERELGRGGMAMVYLARDLKHDRLVAIKLLRGGRLGSVPRIWGAGLQRCCSSRPKGRVV